MKPRLITVILLLPILFLSSCAHEESTASMHMITGVVPESLTKSLNSIEKAVVPERFPGFDPTIKHEGEGWELYSEGDNYESYIREKGTSGVFQYYYYIFDQDHRIVEEGGYDFGSHDLSIEQTSDDVVWMHSWTGIGPGTRWSRYYSVSRNEFSDVFRDVFDQYGEVIVYETNHKTLVVRDIFDEQAYFIELSEFSKPLCDNPAPFQGAKLLNDGKSLEVTYMAEEDESAYGFIMYTETIDLAAIRFHLYSDAY